MTFTAVVGAGLRPALTSLITKQAGRREQGVIIGLTQSLTSVAQIAAPPLAGFIIGRDWLTAWAIWAAFWQASRFSSSHASTSRRMRLPEWLVRWLFRLCRLLSGFPRFGPIFILSRLFISLHRALVLCCS